MNSFSRDRLVLGIAMVRSRAAIGVVMRVDVLTDVPFAEVVRELQALGALQSELACFHVVVRPELSIEASEEK
jgi:hypothetical protein